MEEGLCKLKERSSLAGAGNRNQQDLLLNDDRLSERVVQGMPVILEIRLGRHHGWLHAENASHEKASERDSNVIASAPKSGSRIPAAEEQCMKVMVDDVQRFGLLII